MNYAWTACSLPPAATVRAGNRKTDSSSSGFTSFVTAGVPTVDKISYIVNMLRPTLVDNASSS